MVTAKESVRDQFFLWLSKKVSPAQLSEYCIVCIDIEKFCLQEKILDNKLFETTDFKFIDYLINVVGSNTIYKKFRAGYGHNSNKVNTALKYYRDFLKANFEPPDNKEKVVAAKIESTADKIDSNKKSFKKWLKIKYVNESIALKYLNFLDTINKILKDKKIIANDLFLIADPEKLRKLKNQLFGKLSFANLNFLTAFDNLIEFWQGNSTAEKIPAPIMQAEQKFSIPTVKPATTETKNIAAEKIPEPPVKTEVQISNVDKYAEILSKFFGEDGYKLGKIISRNRFKNYFLEVYGENPEDSAEQIEEILKSIGTQRDNRIFPKQNENQNRLLDDIVNDIVAAFEAGASAGFVEAVYDKYKKPLADNLKIYNAETCATLILEKANRKFFRYYKEYFSPRIRKATPQEDILRLLKEKHKPLSYKQIFENLWYIPRNKIEFLIKAQIHEVVNVASEMFFYAPNLPLDETELQKVSSLLQAEIDFHGYITDVKMMELIKSKYPNITLNLSEFSAYAVRKCLGYILRENFAFNGSVISAKGSQLNLSDVFADFAREHETLTLEELKDFAKELDTPSIYWSPVLNEMVRVSKNKFVRKDLLNINVTEIDNCLAEMYPQNYLPLKEITLFLNLPTVGYAWNIYLLESYLYSFSRQFRLVHSSFSESGVYGAMVRVGAPISDYESLITDALSYSDALTESKALQFIVDQGYQQRKAYKNIGDVIRNAKIIRDNRKRY